MEGLGMWAPGAILPIYPLRTVGHLRQAAGSFYRKTWGHTGTWPPPYDTRQQLWLPKGQNRASGGPSHGALSTTATHFSQEGWRRAKEGASSKTLWGKTSEQA